MYSEIASVLPAPVHAALILTCFAGLLSIPAFHIREAIKSRRAHRELQIRMGIRSK